ncbi:MAG: 50S ribosomal protein L21 [Nitrososphaerales archaeon]
MPKSRGYRRKTRAMFHAKARSPLGSLLRKYEVGDRVTIDVDSRQIKGMPHRRFQGSVGSVEQVGRRVLRVIVPVGNKTKIVTARFEHVKPIFVQSATAPEK